jgi:predicted enzyme related to lactoylglutathione lyase
MTMKLGMVTIDCAEPYDLADFWAEALDTEVMEDFEGDFMILAPWGGGSVALGLQRVPEELVGKNRVHLDLQTDDRAWEVERLLGLGATFVSEQKVPGLSWSVLADPAGNVFCVSEGEH